MRASLVIIECPKCKSPFEAPRQRKAVCVDVDCRFVFCKECFEPFHEFEDCKEAYIQERIEEMIDIEPDGVTQCPGCRIPYLKNPNACDHVDCETQNCEIDFCFKCACIRSPTLAHGNHYHRPSCPFYNLYDGYDDSLLFHVLNVLRQANSVRSRGI
jgi:hypothetical protein